MTTAALGTIGRVLFDALHPLKEALSSASAFEQLLRDLGHDGSVTDEALADLSAAEAIVGAISTGEALIDRIDDPAEPDMAGALVGLIDLGQQLLAAVDELRNVNGAALDPSLADSALWSDLAQALPGHLLVEYLEAEIPAVYAALRFTGVITDVDTGSATTREVIDGEQLAQVASDPIGAIRDRYGWGGTSGFDHQRLIEELALVLTTIGVEVRTGPVRGQFVDQFFDGDTAAAASASELAISLVSELTEIGYVDTGLALVPVPADAGGSLEGLVVTNTNAGGAIVRTELAIDDWWLEVTGGLDSTGLVALRMTPTATTLEDQPPEGGATFALVGEPLAPWQLLGDLIEVGGVNVEIELAGSPSNGELKLAAEVVDGAISLSLGDGDSFLQSVMGTQPLRLELSPRLQWSSTGGLSLSGSIGLSVVIPLAVRLGPIEIDQLQLAIVADGEAVKIQVDIDAGAELGPIIATVQGVGIALEVFASDDGTGSLGPWDVRVVFVPPEGVGVGLDVGVASGGGYLWIDAAAGSYAGVLDLEVLGVGISAVAIIDTKLPDVDGWSMFFALFLDLPSIQLGFGFTLNGVGGVAGINRAIDVDALGSAVRSGSLGTILFPEDPIADAPIIIDAFRSIFPPADGSYVFGPIVKLGWGTPPLIEAELGIVIQLPDPLVIVVLGSLSAVLPTAEAALVELHLDVAGAIDFQAGTLSVDASLHDSHVVGFALSGDMALRAEFGNAQAFLMSVGGFHPRFDPPGDFPVLRRVTFGISAGSLLRIDFEAYFALTSNSVQCGARFTLDAEVMGFGVYGSAGFDAMIQFSPFRLITSVDFEISIKAAGVDLMGVMLYASVEGPNRWHVIGTARFEVLGFGKDIRVDEMIGAKENEPPVEAADVLEDLLSTLETEDAWNVIEVNDRAVTLTEITDPNAPMYANPDALIEVRQRYVPLGIAIQRFGDAPVGDHTLFDIEPVDGEQIATLDDWFAPGHFFPLSNDEKLEGPEFELLRSGLQFGGTGAKAGPDVGIDTGYKAFILDPEFPDTDTKAGFTAVYSGIAGVATTPITSGGFTAVQKYTVGTVAPTYAVVDDGGATVGPAHVSTWTEAYARKGAGTGLHIERVLTQVSG